MNDDEKLSRPAFESLPCGYSHIGTSDVNTSGAVTRKFAYDTVIIDKKDDISYRASQYSIPLDIMSSLFPLEASAKSGMKTSGANNLKALE